MSGRIALLAVSLGLLTTLLLALGHRSVGYARDEGVYFEASRHYAAWAGQLVRDPPTALRAKVRDRAFRINHEHPALLKLLGGLSARALATAPQAETGAGDEVDAPDGGLLPLLREGAAMRLPAQLLAGLASVLLFLAGCRLGGGPVAGLLAVGFVFAAPHWVFHAGLHAFDVPIAVATLAVVLAYHRGLSDPRFGLATGVLLGVALAMKHNALFVAPLLFGHYLLCLCHARFVARRRLRTAQLFPLPLASILVVAPLVAFALWPWLWSDPTGRLAEYLAFHRDHAYYNMEYLGRNYNRPPLPVSYPFVMTLATVPALLLGLAVVGLGLRLADDLREIGESPATPSFSRPLPAGWAKLEGVSLALFALFPPLLIAMPSIPIFGGTKHWLTAYPFLALAAALAFGRLAAAAGLSLRGSLASALALALVLSPGIAATVDGYAFGLSQYTPLIGGPRGAAEMGLNRGFWGHAAGPVLEEGEALFPRGRVYLHDLHELARKQYAREGRWPAGWTPSDSEAAHAGFVFHELHMLSDEARLWNALSNAQPRTVVTLDDVPLTSFYTR